MSTDGPPVTDDETPGYPADLLPEASVVSLDESLDMHAAVGYRTRYEILSRLVHGGDATPTELSDALGIEDNALYYHLNELLGVGLVEKPQHTERDQDGADTYYQATVFSEVTLIEGVDEFVRGEHAFDETYDSSAAE